MPEEEYTDVPKFAITGPSLKQASLDFQIISILTKKLGGFILIDVDEELKTIKGFMMQQNPDGNILIKAS